MKIRSALLAGVTLALLAASAADAAEIKIMAPRAVWTVLNVAGPDFEHATGNKLNVSVDLAADVVRRVNAGEAFDLAVAAPVQIDGLVKDGKLIADTRTDLTRAGIGVEVRKGAPKPDISTADAFKRAMLDAKSIGHTRVGTGPFNTTMFKKLGIYDEIKDKIKFIEGKLVAEAVRDGDVEIGIQQTNVIQPFDGALYLGPLPKELMEYGRFGAGLLTISKEPEVAKAFIKFMAAPENAALVRKSAMETPES